MSTAEDTFARVSDIIVENLGVDAAQITMDTHFRDDLDADSLDLAELIMEFEEQFNVGDISEDDAMKIQTVGDAVNYLTNALDNA
ncbi:MAG: acyl carrier protein [Ardenticatenales bacterium]|nr:acyl carrier protein [Ardenticatenales bacterium]MCC7019283.1 acyl carrier protein [Ardenticatenales bacterium]